MEPTTRHRIVCPVCGRHATVGAIETASGPVIVYYLCDGIVGREHTRPTTDSLMAAIHAATPQAG